LVLVFVSVGAVGGDSCFGGVGCVGGVGDVGHYERKTSNLLYWLRSLEFFFSKFWKTFFL